MSTVRAKLELRFSATLELSEAEIMALDGIFGYNVEAFLKVFYEKMGRGYVEPHEAGVRSLHKTIRPKLAPVIAEIKRARAKLSELEK